MSFMEHIAVISFSPKTMCSLIGLVHLLIAALGTLVPVQSWDRYRSSDKLVLVQHNRSSIAPQRFGVDSQGGKRS